MIRCNDTFIQEYNHFRLTFGRTNQQVADRLGMRLECLVRRVQRLGVYVPDPHEQRASRTLDRLIASGEEFSADQLPCLVDDKLPASLMNTAVSAGLVRKVGVRKAGHGKRVVVYVGAAA